MSLPITVMGCSKAARSLPVVRPIVSYGYFRKGSRMEEDPRSIRHSFFKGLLESMRTRLILRAKSMRDFSHRARKNNKPLFSATWFIAEERDKSQPTRADSTSHAQTSRHPRRHDDNGSTLTLLANATTAKCVFEELRLL